MAHHRKPGPPAKTDGGTSTEAEIAALKEQLPAEGDWRTTDAQEIARRRLRALQNPPAIRNLEPARRIHSDFEVTSPETGRTYRVELLDLKEGLFYSTSPDFATAALGTCKHTESVLYHLRERFPKLYRAAATFGADRPALIVRDGDLFLLGTDRIALPRKLRLCVEAGGARKESCPCERLVEVAGSFRDEGVRISAQVPIWMEERRREAERGWLRREYEQKVHSGEFPQHETTLPLFPYQRAGMLHLAFKERAMVADEMGLGKTVQGIAAAALLHRMGKASRCLIVCPASLKAEWQEQIAKFTPLGCEVVYGPRSARVRAYGGPSAFFTIVNYEQVRSDSLDINAGLRPDIVILDEAQRIKNWASQTARAIKRLDSRYAFVLTGTPIENRIDELYSIVEFLDPSIFGALFRFNREYYQLDERGRPEGYRNLDQLRAKVAPVLLRRRKAEVETELPDRSDENRFVELTEGQKADYASCQDAVRVLIHKARKRPLRREEHQRLMGHLGMMRMLCDSQFILDRETRISPKLDELKAVFETALADADTKVIVFSEWVGMLELIRDHLERRKVGYAWHTGSVPQKKRRAEITAFKEDPGCRVFLCTESGGAGLNLQNASLVVNVDLPWNPAKLEQRIARAWRKGQRRPVQVINLIAQGTIEHGMLETLAHKQGLADGVLDGLGELDAIPLKRGGQSFLSRLEQTLEIGRSFAKKTEQRRAAAADPAAALGRGLKRALGDNLRRCEEHFPPGAAGGKLYLVVDDLNPSTHRALREQLAKTHPDLAGDAAWVEENVILLDTVSHGALEQMRRAGLVRTAVRAKRDLLAPGAAADGPRLSEEQAARLAALRAEKAQRMEAAGLLIAGGLHGFAAEHLSAALLAEAGAAAVESLAEHIPESLAEIDKASLPEGLRRFTAGAEGNDAIEALHAALAGR